MLPIQAEDQQQPFSLDFVVQFSSMVCFHFSGVAATRPLPLSRLLNGMSGNKLAAAAAATTGVICISGVHLFPFGLKRKPLNLTLSCCCCYSLFACRLLSAAAASVACQRRTRDALDFLASAGHKPLICMRSGDFLGPREERSRDSRIRLEEKRKKRRVIGELADSRARHLTA